MNYWSSFQDAMKLKYHLPLMQRRIRDAQRITLAFLRRSRNPYIAFSGGKDSLAALDLTLALRPDVQVVWHDEDWLIPGTAETIEAVEHFYSIRVIRVRERFSADEFFKEYGVWPACAQHRAVDFEADHWPEIVGHFGWDGAIIALRAEESFARRFALKNPLRWHMGQEEWRVSPVHDWSFEDVWAYILGKRLPYHPAYRQMIDLGIEARHARIGPLTANRVYQYGALETVKRLWPEIWNQFSAENPCVR